MPISAWLMLLFGCIILYGGLGVCIAIARKGNTVMEDAEDTP